MSHTTISPKTSGTSQSTDATSTNREANSDLLSGSVGTPETNRSQERRSILERITARLFGQSTGSQSFEEATAKHRDNRTAASTLETAEHEAQSQLTLRGACLRIKGQMLCILQVRSLKEIGEWIGKTAAVIVGAIVAIAQQVGRTLAASIALQKTIEIPSGQKTDSIDELRGSNTAAPTQKFAGLGADTSPKRTDYTSQALFGVAEATRLQQEKDKEKGLTQTERVRREKIETRSLIERIDLADGTVNPDLSAILQELDGTFGSTESALRNIMAAQFKEAALKKRQ